jgi:hypothetical protein
LELWRPVSDVDEDIYGQDIHAFKNVLRSGTQHEVRPADQCGKNTFKHAVVERQYVVIERAGISMAISNPPTLKREHLSFLAGNLHPPRFACIGFSACDDYANFTLTCGTESDCNRRSRGAGEFMPAAADVGSFAIVALDAIYRTGHSSSAFTPRDSCLNGR